MTAIDRLTDMLNRLGSYAPFEVAIELIAIWIVVIGALRIMAKADPMMRQVYVRHIGYRRSYRPTSSPWRRY